MNDDVIASQRTAHKDDPIKFFQQLLTAYWNDHEPEQTEAKWRQHCLEQRWYAEDVLDCFTTILADPPQDLADMMQEYGSIMLPHGDAPYTVLWHYRRRYEDWLTQTHLKFREVFEETAT